AKERGNNIPDLVTTLRAQAEVLVALEQEAEALEVYERCEIGRASCRARVDPRRLASVYDSLGRFYKQRTEYAQALAAYQQALSLLDGEQEPQFYGVVLHDLGDVYQEQEAWEPALNAYQQAAKYKERGQNLSGLVTTLRAQAEVLVALEREAEALEVYERC